MNALNLPKPSLIDTAVPANQRLGKLLGKPIVTEATHPIQPAQGYAGDIALALAHAWWESGAAVMIDVRSHAERDWVGVVPGVAFIPWKLYPGMALNPRFASELEALVPKDSAVLFLCRSGVRSIGAALRAQELGYARAYNILEGFEGDADSLQHRNAHNGWRHAGFAWQQG